MSGLLNPESVVGERFDRFEVTAAMPETRLGMLFQATEVSDGHSHRSSTHVMRLLGGEASLRHYVTAHEAEFLGNAVHPNLLAYDAIGRAHDGRFAGAFYFVRMHAERTLRRLLMDRPAMSDVARDGASQILSGLHYLHGNQWVHGDVKPSNIAIDDETGVWRLVDHGLLPLVGGRLSLDGFRERRRYLAPELVDARSMELRSGTAAADVYAFAVSWMELLLGRDVQEPVREITALRAHPELGADDFWPSVLEACLSTDPQARPTSMALAGYFEKAPDTSMAVRRMLGDPSFVDRLQAHARRGASTRLLDAGDLVGETLASILARTGASPELAVRLSGPSALLKYATTVMNNLAVDRYRASAREHAGAVHMFARSDVAQDPVVALERANEALAVVQQEVGPESTRLLWLATYGQDVHEIARTMGRETGDAWDTSRVALSLFRLRRAYPELSDVLLPLDGPDVRDGLEAWLLSLGLTNAVDRTLVAGYLTGASVQSAALAAGVSRGQARRRLGTLSSTTQWLSILLRGSQDQSEDWSDVTDYLTRSVSSASVTGLDGDWLDSVRDHAARLLGDAVGRGGEAAVTAAVAAILEDATVAAKARTSLLEGVAFVASEEWSTGAAEDSRLVIVDIDGPSVPRFQLTDDLRDVWPVVAAVNRVLDAANDPWGTLAWWSQPNGRLGSLRPFELVGSRDEDLLSLAEANASGV